jgi:hypothetical protein
MRRALLSAVCALTVVAPTLAQAQTYHGTVGNTPFLVLTIPAPADGIAPPPLPPAPPPPLPAAPRYEPRTPRLGEFSAGDEMATSFGACVRGIERRLGYGFSEAINGCIVLSFTRFNWSKDYAVNGCVEVAMPLTQWPDEALRPNCERRYSNNYARWGK